VFETIEWASGHEPAIITKMNKDNARRKEAAAAMMVNDTRSRATAPGKPLFNTGMTSSSFFKNIKIPSVGFRKTCIPFF
jgi:DnaJ family protein C protein 17